MGARQAGSAGWARGGGYLENCGAGEFQPPDPRMDELRRIGLPRAWLMVAERIGFDAWLDVWRMLSDADFHAEIRMDTGGTRMPRLRSFASYLRFQRNRYIESLSERGLDAEEIQRAVARNLGESLSPDQISRLMKRR